MYILCQDLRCHCYQVKRQFCSTFCIFPFSFFWSSCDIKIYLLFWYLFFTNKCPFTVSSEFFQFLHTLRDVWLYYFIATLKEMFFCDLYFSHWQISKRYFQHLSSLSNSNSVTFDNWRLTFGSQHYLHCKNLFRRVDSNVWNNGKKFKPQTFGTGLDHVVVYLQGSLMVVEDKTIACYNHQSHCSRAGHLGTHVALCYGVKHLT